ncbi:hypothetical protein MKS88_002824 [Plasmodium brasilianum]|uniref:Uncharacterized protein n=1 Tax=Plasmodium brasilianum TaxID=5824 RepID=A0ACB9YAA8_PLABR|nr:hypothetical protein MKS88_002824 [Plasmodium brasilianum]
MINEYGFIGFNKKEYHLLTLNKNKIIHNKDIIKKYNNLKNVLHIQDSENGGKEYLYNSLNKEDKNLWNRLTSKFGVVFNKNILTKFFCVGTFCLALYPVYTILLNKKIEFIIRNIFKENLFCLNIPSKIKRHFLSISLAEFRSSPFFLSTILVLSYSLYIILKVYIEKYREAKRIKSAVEDYNKNKDEYINTGRDSTDENYSSDYYDDIEENNDFNKNHY